MTSEEPSGGFFMRHKSIDGIAREQVCYSLDECRVFADSWYGRVVKFFETGPETGFAVSDEDGGILQWAGISGRLLWPGAVNARAAKRTSWNWNRS